MHLANIINYLHLVLTCKEDSGRIIYNNNEIIIVMDTGDNFSIFSDTGLFHFFSGVLG